MASIAASVDMAKATVYHYFKAKHDILFEIHEAWIDDLIERFEERSPATQPLEQVRGVCDDIILLIATKPSDVRVFFEYIRELPPELQVKAKGKRDKYQALVEGALREGMAQGALLDRDPRTTAFALFGMCNWTYQWYRPGGALTHTEVASQFFDTFVHGMSATHVPAVS